MTAKEFRGRLKHAWLVLRGYRPAEVRFDERDCQIALAIACHFERMFAAVHPDNAGLRDDINRIVDAAINMYVTYESRDIPF